MRITVSDDTLESLEKVTGQKISKNGDEIIQQVCDLASNSCGQKGKAWIEPEISEKKTNESS